ncbi:Thioredoxin-like [Chitinophaga jiangningensis]|uniref:Thioredoxin-like n=2 Tax=Chitinophaga jiangningensis TaxID=1419482 RepID=A0A1M6VIB2_9BACT|nr:Thioredoxin-like [Chitinophaga jiangningensis]
MKKTFQTLLLAGLLPLATFAQDSTQFIKAGWTELLAKAKKEQKPIFVDTYFEGCHACKEMEVKVFPGKEVRAYMEQNFINTGFDVFKEDFGFDLCSRYLLHGFPTYLIISPEGKLVNVGIGYNDADRFLNFLKETTARYKNGKYFYGYATNVKKEGPAWYQGLFNKKREYPKDSVLQEFLAKQKDKTAELTVKAMALVKELPADYKDYYMKNRVKYQEMYGPDMNSSILARVIGADMKELAGVAYEPAAFEAFLKKHEAEYKPGGDWDSVKAEFATRYILRQSKNVKAYLEWTVANRDMNSNNLRMVNFYNGQDIAKDPALKDLYLQWAKIAVNEKASLELLNSAAHVVGDLDKAAAKQYLTWAVAKAEMMNLTDMVTRINAKIASL